jgi:hypothetical protein
LLGKGANRTTTSCTNILYHIWCHIWYHNTLIWYHIWYHMSAQVTKHIYDITHDVT